MAYTNIDDPSAYFQTALYTGNSGTLTVTNDGNSDLQPDWVWTKKRSDTSHHALVDSSRGATKQIYSNLTAAEETVSGVTAFNTDGFTLGSNGTANLNGATFVGWQWKANGGTTVSNTDGGITTTVQANTDAGFSIVTYTGDGATSQTVGHGLGAVPKMIISKDRGATSNVPSWRCYHEAIGNTKYLTLNSTAAAATFDDWGNTTPTSSVYTIGGSGGYRPTNTLNTNYVAYVFAEKQGYSKFGSYVGNSNVNGTFVYTGFKPAFIMLKSSSAAGNWNIYDSSREGFNVNNNALYADVTNAEDLGSTYAFMDILSNGFKLRRASFDPNRAVTYIYMAFAENPFVTSTGIPTTAR